MKLDININDAKVASFSNRAKKELETQIVDISDKLVDEALRIETSERLRGNEQEVTSSIVQKASELFLRKYDYIKKKPYRIVTEIVALVAMSLQGILFTIAFQDISNNLLALVFAIIFLVVGIITSVLSIMNKI